MGEDRLREQCHSRHGPTRGQGMRRLAQRDGEKASSVLSERLKHDPEADLRRVAFDLLWELGGLPAVQGVLEAYDDETADIRGLARDRLRALSNDELREAAQWLGMESSAQVVRFLADRGDRASIPLLEELSQGPESLVQHAALRALRQLRAPHTRTKPSNAQNTPPAELSQPTRNAARAVASAPTLRVDERERLVQLLLKGSPAARVEAALRLAGDTTNRVDLDRGVEECLIVPCEADDPLIGPVVDGFRLNRGRLGLKRCRYKVTTRTEVSDDLRAEVERSWRSNPSPRSLLDRFAGTEAGRCAAVARLGQEDHPEARGLLLKRLECEPSSDVAVHAARALGGLGPEDRLQALRGQTDAVSFAEFKDQAGQVQCDMVGRLRLVLAEPMPHWHKGTVQSGYDLAAVQTAVAETLTECGADGRDALLCSVKEGATWSGRVAAARALVGFDSRTTACLRQVYDEGDPPARVLATWVLARWREDDGVALLLEWLSTAENVIVRRLAAGALCRRRAYHTLAAHCSDADHLVRWLAVTAAMRSDPSRELVEAALQDPHVAVRRAVASALLLIPQPALALRNWTGLPHADWPGLSWAAKQLAPLLEGLELPPVRVVTSGVQMDGERLETPLRVLATYGLRRLPVASVTLPLLQLLYDSEPLVRHAAALALRQIEAGPATACLRELSERDSVACVREAAAAALKPAVGSQDPRPTPA